MTCDLVAEPRSHSWHVLFPTTGSPDWDYVSKDYERLAGWYSANVNTVDKIATLPLLRARLSNACHRVPPPVGFRVLRDDRVIFTVNGGERPSVGYQPE